MALVALTLNLDVGARVAMKKETKAYDGGVDIATGKSHIMWGRSNKSSSHRLDKEKNDRFNYKKMSPRAKRLYETLQNRRDKETNVEKMLKVDPEEANVLKKKHLIADALKKLTGKKVLSTKALTRKLKDISRSKRKSEQRWKKKADQVRSQQLRDMGALKKELIRRGQQTKASHVEYHLEHARKDPEWSLDRLRGTRKTIRHLKSKERRVQKAKEKDERRGRRREDNAKLVAGIKNKRKRTPRKPLGRRLTSYKARRAHKSGSSKRWDKRKQKLRLHRR